MAALQLGQISVRLVGDEHLVAVAVRAKVEQIASELEGHFDDEERQLVGVLNSLTGAVPWDPSQDTAG